jgi:hypothetical protein
VILQSPSHTIREQTRSKVLVATVNAAEEVAETGSREMTRYLISFDDGAMTFPEEDLPDVAEAAHAVVREAQDAGVWVFGGGLHSHEEVSVVATDGTVTDGPYPGNKAYIGGFSVVDVASREEALEWAGRIAVACRCAQEVREFVPGSTP